MPNPNLSDAILEAGGTVYARKAVTDNPTALLAVDSDGYVNVGASSDTGVRLAGKRIVAGSTALDGSNPTDIVTGLTSITAATVTLRGSSAPGDNTSVLTTAVSGGTLSVYAWKNTGGTDPTLAASTGTETFDYIVWGS